MRKLLTVNSTPLIAVGLIVLYDLLIFELAKAGLIFGSIRTVGFHVDIDVGAVGIWTFVVLPGLIGLGIGLTAWRLRVLEFVGFLAFVPIVALTVAFGFAVFGLLGALCSLHDFLACLSASD